MNVEIGTVAVQFPEKEYINGIFVAMHFVIYQQLEQLHCCKSSERFGLKCEFSLVSNKYIPNIGLV